MTKIRAFPLPLLAVLGLLTALSSCRGGPADDPSADLSAPVSESNSTATAAPVLAATFGASETAGSRHVMQTDAGETIADSAGNATAERPAVNRPDRETPSTSDLELWEYQLAVREVELDSREREIAARETALNEPPQTQEPGPSTTEVPEPAMAPDEDLGAPRDVEIEETSSGEEVGASETAAQNPRRAIPMTLKAGTEFEVELLEALSSGHSVVGDPVRARLIHDLAIDGIVAIRAGARVIGSVVEVDPGQKIGGRAKLVLSFGKLEPGDGDSVPIRATTVGTGRDQRKKDAATIGGSAAGGAILGRVLSDRHKTKRSVLGAVLGAALGAAVASKTPAEPVELEPGTVLRLRLDEWARVSVEPTADLLPTDR